ncbi:MAG: MATE family efflux transporter [Butyrivibrio sp.]|uniref:MATE family efflux transporter n=1 Tax=Butyrivibrio sp. TaxID=28121 RepID=UPI0025EB4BE8|nr:MATE family efflux transporter [Butyrivibrio sp.]MCR5770239.1 MATE family efflux transporter [Butyrivibrio sp.]
MKDRNFLRKLAGIALPIAFQAFMLACVAAADAFMLGSIDQDSMSAVSLATQIQFIQNMILSATVGATVILGAQYWGRKDLESIDDIFCLALRICGILSIIYFIGCTLFPRYLMLLYTDNEDLIVIGIRYLKIAGFSYLLTGISQCYLAMMKITEHVKTVAIVSAMTVITNIILNAFFIYGLHLEERGAASATLAARILEIITVLTLSYQKGYVHPKLSGLVKFNKVLTMDFIKCMWPLLGACLLWGVGFTSYSSFMGHIGKDAAAANSVTAVIRDLVCCAGDGLASGCGIMVGNELGAGNLERGKKYGQKMVGIAFVVGFISTGVMFLFTPIVFMTVRLTDTARHYLLQMMIVMAIYMIGRVVNTVLINGIFAAGGDTIFDMYSLVVSMWFIAIPLAFLGTYIFHWPVIVVYACTCLDEVGKIPWVLHHFTRYKWVKDLTRERH